MNNAVRKKVLVVDDEEDVAFFLKTALEDAGFRVETAASVDEALEKVKADPPDCVSLDMIMPGKTGIVLFHEMHKNPAWAKIPVLFVTAHAREEKVRREMDAAAALAQSTLSGPATYLEKPVTAARFVESVAKALNVDLGPPRWDSSPEENLRKEVLDRVKDADTATLEEALRLLSGRRERP
jgi:CheY-like chemotaxis protein